MNINGLIKSFLLLLTLTSCTPYMQYRTIIDGICDATSNKCDLYALQQHSSKNGNNYLLGFIEFDDQGQLWSRKQMDHVTTYLSTETVKKDILIVVFVHGWTHSAAYDDDNIATFHKVLADLSDAEEVLAKQKSEVPRLVSGVYLGWRGGSISIPIIENLTFWDRKNTADKVGHGGVTEVLSRLENIKQIKEGVMQGKNRTSLVVVGHSFGGLIVHTALAQILEDRFIKTKGPDGLLSDVGGFGNLVVLINPAFEANLFTAMSDMSFERGTYFASQLPVVLVLNSEADWATRYAFNIGRRLSTFFEEERKGDQGQIRYNAVTKENERIDQEDSNVTAVGHFSPYRTHFLSLNENKIEYVDSMMTVSQRAQQFLAPSNEWVQDYPGKKIQFGDVILERTKNSAGRNPYLVANVDKRLIPDHTHINNPSIIGFIKQLILISTQTSEQ